MKLTVVPAQVTTVEDRIVGSLSFSQLLLVITPVFIGGALYGLLPPFMDGARYKYVSLAALAVVCLMLAVRIKGRIVAAWLVTILRYNLRPKYYLYNKNVLLYRKDYPPVPVAAQDTHAPLEVVRPNHRRLAVSEVVRVLAAIEDPAAQFRFESTKKGGLYARFREIDHKN